MIRTVQKVLIFLLVAAGLFCCQKNEEACVLIPDTNGIKIDLQFNNLEDTIAAIETKDQLVHFFTRHPVMRDQLFNRRNYPDDSVFINSLYRRFSHPAFDTLLFETKRIFGDLTGLKAQFNQAFTNLKYYYPDFIPPRIETVISGLETDLVVSDTLIMVSLDYYMGKNGKYRPRLYQYLLNRYEPEDIVPSCMLIFGIGEQFNKTSLDDNSVLADMIAYGKSFYFAKHMLPCVPDSTLIWYSTEEINGARENEDLIWARLIDDQVLFSTSRTVNQKFLGERPKTLEVGEKCPGRIAQWVGWEIVKKYMETHAAVTLPQLMATSDPRQLFRESRYKPERR
jgi:hypothetical protein